MTTRTARLWAVLAGLAAIVVSTLAGTVLSEVLAGIACILLAAFLVALDGLRKRGHTRR
jgi:hypothetical protein